MISSNNKVIIVGAFHEIIELAEKCNKTILGIIDNDKQDGFLGYRILGNDEKVYDLFKRYGNVPLVLSPDAPAKRSFLYKLYSSAGFDFTSLIHPGASLSKLVKIGNGVVIQNFVNISSESVIGNFAKINTFVNVMHNVKVGNFVTLAPNTVLLGYVTVSNECYIGSNSTILPGIKIKRNSFVGAGSVVTKNVDSKTIVYGNPAKRKVEK